MAAPLLAAAKYFGIPRLLGMGADALAQSRMESLVNQGKDPSADTLVNLLSMVPRTSPIENLYATARNWYDISSGAEAERLQQILDSTPDYTPAFHVIERPTPGGVEWYSPIDDYLTSGGTDSSGASNNYGEWDLPFEPPATSESYGQTSYPTPEVTFDAPGAEWGSTGSMYRLLQEMGQQEQPEFDDPGFARGGLLNLLRAHHAKHKR